MDPSATLPNSPLLPNPVASSPASLSLAFEAAVDAHRQSVALVETCLETGRERHQTYGELDDQTTRLARRLRNRGVRPETLVGLHIPRSADAIRALLAILKAGGAYLPLDPANPPHRLRYLLQDSGTRLVLAMGAVPELGAGVQILDLSQELEAAADESSDRFDAGTGPDHLAYVIYTSGSTGRPKGTLVPHRGVLHLMREAYSVFNTGPGSRVALHANLGFDASVLEWTIALTRGAALCPIPPEWIPGPEHAGRLAGLAITHLFTPPSLLIGSTFAVPSLRYLTSGGERLTRALADRLLSDGHEDMVLWNSFGPTETTIFAVHGEIPRSDAGADFEPPLGRPFPGITVNLCDPRQREVENGQEGEILIAGPILTRGYLDRPALTAARFIPDPNGAAPGSRRYRSGDLGRLRGDGSLEFRGRIDFQVKVRGQRIELGEIEALLSRQPSVRAAAVVVVGDGEAAQLVAFYEGAETEAQAGEARALRDAVAAELPRYMVPAAFQRVIKFPITPNGKVDREGLVGRAVQLAPATSERPPQSDTERHIAALWERFLGVSAAANSDFFALGGHSLLAGQLASQLEDYVGHSVSLTAVFDHPTLEELATYLDRLAIGQTSDRDRPLPQAAPPIEATDRSVPLPLSFPQERVWFLNELTGTGNTAYNFQATVDWMGPLRVDLLERALSEIVQRHEVLRSTFTAPRGEARMNVQPPEPVMVPVVDLSRFPGDLREQEQKRLIARGIHKPFNLSRLPLATWTLFRHGIENHTMLQVEHHFVHDGWSFALLAGELKDLYNAFVNDRPSPLQPLPIQYGDYAVWEREWLSGDTLEELLDFWREELRDLPTEAILPTDLPRPKVQSFRGSAWIGPLPHKLADDLRAFVRREGLSLYPVMLTAFLAVLQRYSGRDDLAIGTAAVNRPRPEMDTMIGMVVNTMVLRLDLSGNPTVREALRRAREKTVTIYPHQQAPLDKLVDDVMPHRDLSRNPVVQTMFSFHDSPVPDLDLGELQGTIRVQHNGSAKSDLNVIVVPGAEQRVGRERDPEADRIDIMWEHCVDLLFEDTVVRMRGQFERLLTALLERPDELLSQLPLLSATEREQLAGWEQGTVAGPQQSRQGHQDLLERFHQHALQRPDALAVATPAPDDQWLDLSFDQLARRAVALAQRLRQAGAAQDAPVAILTGHRAELPLSLLASHYASAAYLPMDADLPPERIHYMVSNVGATAAIVTRELRDRLQAVEGLEGLTVLEIDASTLPEAESLPSAAPRPIAPTQPAYYTFTSGSTGRPKAVVTSHRALHHFVGCADDLLCLTPEDRLSFIASPAFDASVMELWTALANGACLETPPGAVRAEPQRLLDWLGERRITSALLPTALAEPILQAWDQQGRPSLPDLRQLVIGGAALRQFTPEGFPPRLINCYGPTEATVAATYDIVGSAPRNPAEVLPSIGRPFPGYTAHILDRDRRRLPRTVPGELHLGGPALANGYHQRPSLTAQVFVPNPYATTPGERLYATGDLARFLPDGRIQFLGRIDQQIKLRGFRIEPGEIEATLQRLPGVDGAIVAVRASATTGELQLVAYWTLTEEFTSAGASAEGTSAAATSEDVAPPTSDTLRTALAQSLPSYMIPSAWVQLPEFPMTPTGKVDTQALPDPDTATSDRPHVAPRTDLEELLADFWCEILGIETPSVHDNFFRLGGQSLTAARLAGLIREELEIDLPLSLLFDHPVLEEQAQKVEALMMIEV